MSTDEVVSEMAIFSCGKGLPAASFIIISHSHSVYCDNKALEMSKLVPWPVVHVTCKDMPSQAQAQAVRKTALSHPT